MNAKPSFFLPVSIQKHKAPESRAGKSRFFVPSKKILRAKDVKMFVAIKMRAIFSPKITGIV